MTGLSPRPIPYTCGRGLHEPGHSEHGRECIPPADPADANVRLLRAVWGLCPDCDKISAHQHIAGKTYDG